MTAAPTVTKAYLRSVLGHLIRKQQQAFGGVPVPAEEAVALAGDIESTRQLLAAAEAVPERGRLVLSWRLPKDLIPTQNDLRGIKPWRLKKIKAAILDSLTKQLPSWPDALAHGSERPRWVRTTRYTTQEPDELSCDGTGFKTCLDVMTAAGCIHSDKRAGLHREATWQKCKPGMTSGLVELYLLADEQVAAAAPAFAHVAQVVHKPGIMTKMLQAGLPGAKGTT